MLPLPEVVAWIVEAVALLLLVIIFPLAELLIVNGWVTAEKLVALPVAGPPAPP